MKKKQSFLNLPNILTLARVLAVPAVVVLYFINHHYCRIISILLYMLAGFTDYLDGYFARNLKQISKFGRFLDPIADKLLVSCVLLMLAQENALGPYGFIPAMIILSREILVSGLREFLAEIKVALPVSRMAKWKTAIQIMGLPMLMLQGSIIGKGGIVIGQPIIIFDTLVRTAPIANFFSVLGSVFLWTAAILTLITGFDYLKKGLAHMDS